MREDVRWLPHPRCSKPHSLWSAPDKDATELEVTAFIAALVRLTKPNLVVETGTYQGHTTAAIADALEANGDDGWVLTYETDQARAEEAHTLLEAHAAVGRVSIYNCTIQAFAPPAAVDLAFLDSSMGGRQAEMDFIWSRITPGGLVLVHDASPLRPPGKVRPPGKHQVLDIATPRGLLVFQRPW